MSNLYQLHQNLFSKVIVAKNCNEIYKIFEISVTEYWQTHYQFDKISIKKAKKLSKAFIDLLIINTVVPFKFAYSKSQGKDTSEENIFLLEQLDSEKNAIIDKYKTIGISSKNAFESQSLLQLKNEYCNKSKCLQCSVGLELLKN